MIKLKKGSQAAKNYMAKIRAMRKGVKKAAKKVNGIKYPKPKLFKPTEKQTKKAAQRLVKESLHKDTKSHNVNIRVLSGIKKIKEIYSIPNGLNKQETKNEIFNFDQALKWKQSLINVSTDTNYKKILRKEIKDIKGILKALKNYLKKITAKNKL